MGRPLWACKPASGCSFLACAGMEDSSLRPIATPLRRIVAVTLPLRNGGAGSQDRACLHGYAGKRRVTTKPAEPAGTGGPNRSRQVRTEWEGQPIPAPGRRQIYIRCLFRVSPSCGFYRVPPQRGPVAEPCRMGSLCSRPKFARVKRPAIGTRPALAIKGRPPVGDGQAPAHGPAEGIATRGSFQGTGFHPALGRFIAMVDSPKLRE
jgi:hypothetical protein